MFLGGNGAVKYCFITLQFDKENKSITCDISTE